MKKNKGDTNKIHTDTELQKLKDKIFDGSVISSISLHSESLNFKEYKQRYTALIITDYLIEFTKAKKNYPHIVVDEYHNVTAKGSGYTNKVRLIVIELLYKHFLETNQIDKQIRECIHFIIANTDEIGSRGFQTRQIANLQKHIIKNSPEIDLKNQRMTLDRAILFVNYLSEFLQVNPTNVNKAKVINFLTGFSQTKIEQKFSTINKKNLDSPNTYVEDIKTIRKAFELLGLDEIVKMIDNDFD